MHMDAGVDTGGGGGGGGAKGAVAPPQPRNIGFFNTKKNPSPPL